MGAGREKFENLDFIHRYIPGEEGGPTLLLLHGVGANEEDLIPLGRELVPGATLLSPRGKISEYGVTSFFRRPVDGVFEVEDLMLRTRELAGFVEDAAETYRFDKDKLVAAGYSNGANAAAALTLLHPGLLRAAILFRSRVPLEPEVTPDLSGMPVFMAAGSRDQMMPPSGTERLANMLREAGAEVDLRWRDIGHPLTYEEVQEAKDWLARNLP